MTSEHTGDPTERFFAKHNYFGLDRKNVHFFEQNTMPCVDMDGKILLETKSSIARAPGQTSVSLSCSRCCGSFDIILQSTAKKSDPTPKM